MNNEGMIYGYARDSTVAQDLVSQLAHSKAAGCANVVRGTITGTSADRPQPKWLMAPAAPDDVVVILAVDHLSRDTTDLLVTARDMQHAGAGLCSLAEPVCDTVGDFAERVLAMLGVAAELEGCCIAEHTSRRRANAKGVKFGREPILAPHRQKKACARLEAGEPRHSVARSYDVRQATISRLPPPQVAHG